MCPKVYVMSYKRSKLKRTSIVLIVAAIIVIASVWLLYPGGTQSLVISDDFESGMGSWMADADVPEDPNNPGENVSWAIERTNLEQFTSANHSLKFVVDGHQDDGAIWIAQKLNLEPNAVRTVNVTFQFWSESESFNTLAAVIGYVGGNSPAVEDDFQVIGSANQVSGWKTYTFESEVTTDDSGNAYVALGIAVRWETSLTYYIDDVQIIVG